MSIKSLSYDEHKMAKIRCLYGRRQTLKMKKEEDSDEDPEGKSNVNVVSEDK